MLRPLAPAEANLATCAPREPPAAKRCCFPAPSAPQGCFLNLPTEAFDEAFISGDAVQILQRKLRVGARRDAACDNPEPPEAPPDSAHEAEGWGSMCSEAVCCEGRHNSCCMVLCAKERKLWPWPLIPPSITRVSSKCAVRIA